jgi:hypothetical protein
VLTCKNCGQKFDLNDSESPIGTKAAGITIDGRGQIIAYANVWCPYCRTEQKKETLQ